MKTLIASIVILGLAAAIVGVTVVAAPEANVSATVTVQSISVTVTDGAVNYGVLGTGVSTSTVALDTQTAKNDGNIAETLNIRGTNSANWTLAAAAGTNQYKHEFSTSSGSTWKPLTTSNQTLASGVAINGTQVFDLQITTPTATTYYTPQTVNVVVLATL